MDLSVDNENCYEADDFNMFILVTINCYTMLPELLTVLKTFKVASLLLIPLMI